MNKMDWCLATYFKESEAWGDPEQMNPQVIWLINNIRDVLPTNCWVKVHKGFAQAGHAKKSQHYLGNAIDYHVVGCSFLDAEMHTMKYLHNSGMVDFVGIGIYPEWLNPGFHIDVRGTRASWSKLKGEYVAYKVGIEYARKHLANGG